MSDPKGQEPPKRKTYEEQLEELTEKVSKRLQPRIYSVCTQCGHPFQSKEEEDRHDECPICGGTTTTQVQWGKTTP